jgi:acetylornithine deacetylase/succinyl-diaminopimelate desuccinylase-like protein
MLDRRLIPGEDPASVLRQLKTHIGELPAGLKISYEEQLNFQYPHRADPACELVQAARNACQAVLGRVKTFYKRSALDMGFFSHHGHDSVLFGPGNHALAHSDHEMVALADFHDACQVYERILEEMVL